MKKLLLLALFCLVGSGVYAQKNSHNGHEWVDLGLPSGLKWATCNVGASYPGDYGNHYAWGEVVSMEEGNESDGRLYGTSTSDIRGNSTYDAATFNWGGGWRLPTMTEFGELLRECTWEWTTQNGHNGYKVTGPNSQSIFLPAAGWRHVAAEGGVGSHGDYWSSTPLEGTADGAYYLYFYEDYHEVNWLTLYDGRSVRPVLE